MARSQRPVEAMGPPALQLPAWHRPPPHPRCRKHSRRAPDVRHTSRYGGPRWRGALGAAGVAHPHQRAQLRRPPVARQLRQFHQARTGVERHPIRPADRAVLHHLLRGRRAVHGGAGRPHAPRTAGCGGDRVVERVDRGERRGAGVCLDGLAPGADRGRRIGADPGGSVAAGRPVPSGPDRTGGGALLPGGAGGCGGKPAGRGLSWPEHRLAQLLLPAGRGGHGAGRGDAAGA